LPETGHFDAGTLSSFLAALPRTTTAAAALAARHDGRVTHAVVTPDRHRRLRHVLEPRHESFFTVDRIQLGQETLGPVAANLQVVGSALAMDQLHAAYRGGFITGQILGDFSRDDARVGFRGNVTGLKATDGRGVLDANVAMTFVPSTLILEGKAQVVRISKDHLYEVLDVLDPYREDEDLNRVRLGLKFGYPKFVLVKMDEGLMNAKVELGGLAGAVRIDEIKGIPVTPFIEQYVQPYIERILSPSAAARAMIVENEGT
jgi:translocation and assembly module TamB